MNRRHLLSAVAGASLASITQGLVAAPLPRWDRILILVELNGGNDGLNTVVAYSIQTYSRLRPTLAVQRDGVLALSEQVGLNAGLQPLMLAWEQRDPVTRSWWELAAEPLLDEHRPLDIIS